VVHPATFNGQKLPFKGTTYLHVGEGYRGRKILSLNVLDELVLRVESTWWLGQAVAFKFKFPADLGPLLRLPDYGRPDFGQSTVIWMPHSRRRETVVGLKVQVEVWVSGRLRNRGSAFPNAGRSWR